MLIAKVNNNQILEIVDHSIAFPTTSFPNNQPTEEFLSTNGYLIVDYKPFNTTTDNIVQGDPYIENNKVYTFKVFPISEEEKKIRLIEEYNRLLKHKLDLFAKKKGFDDILSACSYITSTNSEFSLDSSFAIQKRDQCWETFYTIIESGNIPASFELLEAQLPTLEWN